MEETRYMKEALYMKEAVLGPGAGALAVAADIFCHAATVATPPRSPRRHGRHAATVATPPRSPRRHPATPPSRHAAIPLMLASSLGRAAGVPDIPDIYAPK